MFGVYYFISYICNQEKDIMPKQFGIPLKYNSKLELARYFLDIYFIVKPPKHDLVDRAKEALSYFLVYGFSKDSEESLRFALSKNVKSNYIRVILHMLKKNGLVVIDDKVHKKRLSDEMLYCQKLLFKENVRTFTVGFIEDKNL